MQGEVAKPVILMRMEIRTELNGVSVAELPEILPEVTRGKSLRVTEIGEEILHRPLVTVTEFDTSELHTLIDDMFATLAIAEGVGLAANQVAVDLRLFVYDLLDPETGVRHVGHVFNPELETDDREGTEEMGEGCLSVPGPHADLFRNTYAVVTGQDVTGAPIRLEGHGYFARLLQHETDHLNGRLYVDLLSKRERKRVLKEMASVRDDVFEHRRQVAQELGKTHPDYPEVAPLQA